MPGGLLSQSHLSSFHQQNQCSSIDCQLHTSEHCSHQRYWHSRCRNYFAKSFDHFQTRVPYQLVSGMVAGLVAGMVTGLVAGMVAGLIAGMVTGLVAGASLL